MPNLVGIGNSQVPTNAMLGGLAYQDSVGEIDVDKIKARTSDTATDVFVYDTRKDSDGGAWRHRTQNTSWYDEEVSATRGARKEFPAVAVIVAKTDTLIIYDGDDPNLPMWMVFNLLGAVGNPNSNMIPRGGSGSESDITSIACLNGKLAVGLKDVNGTVGEGLVVIDFISELARIYRSSGSGYTGAIYRSRISGRNSNSIYYGDYNELAIVTEPCNDVAMTVLPNAPIDETTGLPIPTIGVATPDGVSIIKDDGTVVDIIGNHGGSNNDTQFVDFDSKTNAVISGFDYGANNTNAIYKLHVFPIPETDITENTFYNEYQNHHRRVQTGSNITIPKLKGNYLRDAISAGGNGRYAIRTGDSASTGYPGALNIIQEDPGTDGYNTNFPSNSRIAYITKDYNTGWMHGDIKGAFLADTDTATASIANRDLILNSTFANTNNWTGASNGVLTITGTGLGSYASGSVLRITNTGGSNGRARSNSFSTTVGKKYGIKVSFTNRSSGGQYRVEVRQSGNDLVPMSGTTTAGVYNFEFLSKGTGTYILELYCLGNDGEWAEFDDVHVYELEQDRSQYEKGLQIVGTITKEPVATGSDLVYYRNFSDSNYLLQPYNSELDFGTGDLYIMFWANFTQNDAYDLIMARRAHNGSAYTGNGWYIEMGNDQNIQIKNSSGGTRAQIDADSDSSVWQHMCFVRRNNISYSYKDGILQSNTYAWTENLDNSSAVLTIGRNTVSGGGDADKTRLALVRIGASAPSEKQIKKIYNDEKCLFHENAKCTLYGTSDNIKAIAYDDTNDILHVGTSSGRSEFQGLNRINNTTTAVTTAISASNELVAEQ